MTGIDFLSVIIIAFGLSADCFAVALGGAISKSTFSRMQVFRVALSFGIFQALMLVLGWLAGRTVVEFISAYDHWLAFGFLLIVGGRMIWESFHDNDDDRTETDITRGLLLLTLSVATSIDSLAVGLSFAFLKVNIILASGVVGFIAFVITIVGFLLGKKVGSIIGKRAEMIGGAILIAIAFRILLEHIL